MTEESIFAQPEYHTPQNAPRSGLRRVLGRRFAFYLSVGRIVFRSRARAVRDGFDDSAFIASSLAVMRSAEACDGVFHVTGLDCIRNAPGPSVFIANHMSTLETFVLPAMIMPFKPFTFIVKESLTRHRMFGEIMRSRDPITVTRKNAREDFKRVMQQGPEVLAAGRSICVFPQSTRSSSFSESRFNTIGVKLAKRAGVSIVPVALKTDFWGNGKWIKDFGPIDSGRAIHIAFGDAIPTEDSQRDVQGRVLGFLKNHLTSWGVPWET